MHRPEVEILGDVPIKGLSHDILGGYCYTSIQSSFQGLLSACGGIESDKSQERTDLLSEGTGLIYRAGKL